ncbi:MAG TPA: peptidylprolyl isomerase [Prolixibacteraceae bacterium]|jgi:peptidyl-prolyl cis-trans isomerase SurA|nr:peptidylprolyl isomerase [Prolixibacteraceae bacterium]HPR84686.1 peptidylprolyl isomerase [Prolixibacteraceae bacterium]
MIRKLIGLFILAGCVVSGKIQAQDKVVDQITAVVGKNIILKSDIEGMYLQQQAQGITSEGDAKCEILENLLVEKLLLAEAELDTTITVSDSQLNQSMEQRIQYFISHLGSEKEVEAYFKKSIVELKSDMQEVIKNQQMTQQMQGKIVDKVTITPAEVRMHFKNLPESEIPQIAEQVEYAQITVQPEVPIEEEDRIKSTLRELKRRIESGESGFAPLAVMYSEDGSAKNGGELDYMGRGNLDPAYAAAAFNLKGDKISNVVKSEFGYHIIQVMDRKGELIKTRHILMMPKPSDKSLTKSYQRVDSIANFIRDGKFKFEEAAQHFSYDKDSRNNGGVVINPESGDSKWKLSELDPDVSKVVANMKVGEISKPFKTIDQKNQQVVYKIVKLVNKHDAHPANLRDDYVELSNIYMSKKKEQTLDKWIRDKQSGTYVHIDDSYLNCNFKYKGWIK